MPTMDGGFLITGESLSSGGDLPGHYGDGFSNDGIVIKTDSLGNVLWSKNLGTSGDDGIAGNSLEIDRGFYILNVSCGGYDFDMAGSGISGRKRWLIKMDSLDNIVDENIISGETDFGIGVGREMIYHNDMIIMSGSANPLTNYFPDVHGFGGTDDGGIGIFNKDLDFVDLKIFGESLGGYIYRIITNENGDYYAFGLSKPLDGDLPANYNNGSAWDYWLFKLDPNFNVIWSRNFGGSGNCEIRCSGFLGNLLIKNNILYVFAQNQVPDVFPDYDIECGHVDVTAIAPMDAWLVAFDLTTGIPTNVEQTAKVNVNPNPVNDILTIEVNASESNDCNLKLFDLLGNLVLAKNYNGLTNIKLNVATLPNGPYLLKVQIGDEHLINKKIIIQN